MQLARTAIAKRLLWVFLFGFALAALTYFGVLHVLFVAEILTTFSFGWLMVHTANRLSAQ
ncbi:hypothetical protein IPL68_00210 [Candidatus Saccharibacteria bacterium]|nr:MAG: hypothetical protein IPL68_00210 [Candidatus Saccharibacteria bacterium]